MRTEEQTKKLTQIRIAISKLIREKRIQKSLQPAELASMVKVKTARIKKYGTTIKNLDVALFFLICEVLDISMEDVYNGIYKNNPPA